ncbi:MAG TPA: deoxyribonuclease IV [Longimicrobiales bacterium]|nr:deoxyribonuclease IV [Longimicrobiales bacterium]
MTPGPEIDELGAHVSAQGGPENAPGRAGEIGSVVFQLFTKQPNRWAEPRVSPETAAAFREARRAHGITCVASHDSYLINLASPDPSLWKRSLASFRGELERCEALGVELLVTHPGNATDGDQEAGIARNARGIAEALDAVPGSTRVLLEITAGSGSSVGASFEKLAAILDAIPEAVRPRVGVCFDTCHAYAAGYDLVGDYDGVWDAFERVVGTSRLGLFHLNDSQHPLGSRKDRHAGIGEGTLGPEPFRRIMTDSRFRGIPKVLETPKGDDGVTADRANLALLRGFRSE